ncbi:hypothetical protein [Allokutzneria sp. NRRL B-24872]|uniref:DUF3885 domain-containing protein n=1 Tax=Allokutzneria sp. NRRL B-24872 TaxID=1137961 RepID=UPI000A39BF6F|nr:hypothetical protein [Allokutzneria sp. NRRL B-24872]
MTQEAVVTILRGVPALDLNAVTAQWERMWPNHPPVGSSIRYYFADRWVRFHSLPGSQRYATCEAEYQIVLDRHNTILRELVATTVYLMTVRYDPEDAASGTEPVAVGLHPGAVKWMRVVEPDDPEYALDLYISSQLHEPGCFDQVLRYIADDRAREVIIADTALRWLYHPYDGGADVILATSRERDLLKAKFSDWLSARADGH